MDKSRSRSHSGERGRWGDPINDVEDPRHAKRGPFPDNEHDRQTHREQDHGRGERRSGSRDRQRDRSQLDGHIHNGGRSRSKSRDRHQSRDHRREWSKERSWDRNHERDRDRSRWTDRARTGSREYRHDASYSRQADVRDADRGRGRFLERDRNREFDRRLEQPRGWDADKAQRRSPSSRSPGRGWGRDTERGLKRRSSSRSRSPERGRRRWGSPQRGAADGGGEGAAVRPIEEATRRRWRSRSPAAAGRGDVGDLLPPPTLPGTRAPLSTAPISLAPPPVGSIHRATVHTIRPFGIFVALAGFRRHVLVHSTQVSDELRFTREDDEDAKVKALEFYFPQGEKVWVKITEVAPDERNPAEMRINGSLRAVDQTSGTDLDPAGQLAAEGAGRAGRGQGGPETDEPPEVGSVHQAVVKRIEAYGVFVAMEGYRRHGLVHTSQVSNYLSFTREDSDEQKKAELAGVVAMGEQVWVKVVEVAADDVRAGYKIGCSMKLVSQANGEDLDPTNMRYRPRDAPGKGGPGVPSAIGAHAGEVGKGGKIDWGHLAADTKLYVDEKAASKYKLLEEEPPPVPGATELGGPPARGAPVSGPMASGPVGRGRGMVLPAWMTQGRGRGGGGGGPPAPGSLPGPPPHPPQPVNQLPPSSKFELVGGRDRDVDPGSLLLDLVGGGGSSSGGGGLDAPRISSIEEALAILEEHGGGRGKSSKKDKKKKKDKDKSKDRSKSGKKWK